MSSADTVPDAADARAMELVRRLANLDPATLDLRAVQLLMRTAVRAYGAMADRGAAGAAFPPGEDVSATEAVRAASAILRAARLETFELALWESFGGLARDPRRDTA